MFARLRPSHPEFILAGVVAAVAVTWPVALSPLSRAPGSEFMGFLSHAWKYWWTGVALLDLHVNPAFTRLADHPRGLAVGYHLAGFLDPVLALPITRALGPVAGVNAYVFGVTVAATWATGRLALRTGLSRGAALLASLLWVLAPYHLGALGGGSTENLADPWTPLLLGGVASLLGLLPDPAPARPARVALGVAASLLLLACTAWLSGAVWAASLGVLALAVLVVRRRPALPGVAWVLGGLAVGGVAVILAARVLLPEPTTAASGLAESILSGGPPRFAEKGAVVLDDAPRGGLLDAWRTHYVPLSLILLLLAGLWTRRGRLWGALTLASLLHLAWPHPLQGLLARASEIPGASLAHILSTETERRMMPLHLALALAAGHAAAWATSRLPDRWRPTGRWGVPLLLLGAVLGEVALSGPVALPVPSFVPPRSASAAWLATQAPGAVIDVPIGVTGPGAEEWAVKGVNSRYLYLQTIHGHPVLAGVGSRYDYRASSLPSQDPLVLALASYGDALDLLVRGGLPPGTVAPPRAPDHARDRLWADIHRSWDPASLRREGFAWIVVHGDLLREDDRREVGRLLERLLGAPARFGRTTTVFALPTGPVPVRPDAVVTPPPPAPDLPPPSGPGRPGPTPGPYSSG